MTSDELRRRRARVLELAKATQQPDALPTGINGAVTERQQSCLTGAPDRDSTDNGAA